LIDAVALFLLRQLYTSTYCGVRGKLNTHSPLLDNPDEKSWLFDVIAVLQIVLS
jgi:hypothetical protein